MGAVSNAVCTHGYECSECELSFCNLRFDRRSRILYADFIEWIGVKLIGRNTIRKAERNQAGRREAVLLLSFSFSTTSYAFYSTIHLHFI